MGGGELFLCAYPLKVHACPPRVQDRLSGLGYRCSALITFYLMTIQKQERKSAAVIS